MRGKALSRLLLLYSGWLCLLGAASGSPTADLVVQVAHPQRWKPVLSSVGVRATLEPARFRIAVGDSRWAQEAGFQPTEKTVRVAGLVDERDPQLEIVWKDPLQLPVYTLPSSAKVFVREKWTGAPLVAGLTTRGGGLLWVATDPGARGYERFPYVVHALVDLGLVLPFRGARTWAFFDYSYRTRADPDYLARRWREAGIAAIHAAAWHFYDESPERKRYLTALIAACHRQGVLVYAWLEFPHVSEDFWRANPACREKTAALQDAHLDWRKLINLAEPSCFQSVVGGLKKLLSDYDWDGVNLAELYFESLHGPSNPQRFTPMNGWVRVDYRARSGIDPLRFFDSASIHFRERDRERWKDFVDYRARLALRLHKQFLELIRSAFPNLDLVVTQIDDRFDRRMREFLGADTSALLSIAEQYDFRLVLEDPATLWDRGPERYVEIARQYRRLAPDPERLAIDINIVERYQTTYPTKKQVGGELFQLVHLAGKAFPTVLLYFEQSISRPDWDLLPHASGRAHARREENSLLVNCDRPVGVVWSGPALVDGRPWPFTDGSTVWLPPGRHRISPAADFPSLRVLHMNTDWKWGRIEDRALAFGYASAGPAIVLLSGVPKQVTVDGEPIKGPLLKARSHWAVMLPRGRHSVRIAAEGLLP